MYIPPLPNLPDVFTQPHEPSDDVFEAENAYIRGLLDRFGSDRDAPEETMSTIETLKAIFIDDREFALENDEDYDVFVDYVFFIMEAALLPVEMNQEAYDAIIDYANAWMDTRDADGTTGLLKILQELNDVSIVHGGFVVANRILESMNRAQGHSPQFLAHTACGATLH